MVTERIQIESLQLSRATQTRRRAPGRSVCEGKNELQTKKSLARREGGTGRKWYLDNMQ